MKILVTGAAGMLGSDLCPVLREEGHAVYPTDINTEDKGIEFLDVRNIGDIRNFAEKVRPEIIVHLAAETDVDKCELEQDHAYKTNAFGTYNVALVCKEKDILMVHISTAGVFDGEKQGPYIEFDEPNPINAYGRSKLAAEEFVKDLLDRYFIVRAGWMMGGGKKDKKFVHKIIRQIEAGKKELQVVTDKIGAPTYTLDFSRCLAKLIRTSYYGLYHMVCKGKCTRFEVAEKMLEILGRKDIKLNAITSDQFPLPAPRARSEVMRNFLLECRGMNTMRAWEVCLEEYLHKHFAHVKRR